MHFMHSPVEFVNHFVLLSFDVLDIKFIFIEEFKPSTLPGIQSRLVKKIFQTILVCSQLKPCSDEVVSPFI
jgi:hypothetical protein